MPSEQKKPYHFLVASVLVKHISCSKEVAQGFGHLLVVDVEKSRMHPVIHERMIVRSLRLCDFVFVMRKLQIFTAAVYIEVRSKKRLAHHRTFDMPAWSARSPRRRP